MMNVTYGVTEEIYSLGAASRVFLWIAAYADAEEDGTATIAASVHVVTSNKQALCELSTVHLMDMVEDFLAC